VGELWWQKKGEACVDEYYSIGKVWTRCKFLTAELQYANIFYLQRSTLKNGT
jgi:hypothetical protein